MTRKKLYFNKDLSTIQYRVNSDIIPGFLRSSFVVYSYFIREKPNELRLTYDLNSFFINLNNGLMSDLSQT